MGVLEDILSARQLSDFQSMVTSEGRHCLKCGAKGVVTPSVSGAPDVARIYCPACKAVRYEIQESEGVTEEHRTSNVVPFKSTEER